MKHLIRALRVWQALKDQRIIVRDNESPTYDSLMDDLNELIHKAFALAELSHGGLQGLLDDAPKLLSESDLALLGRYLEEYHEFLEG